MNKKTLNQIIGFAVSIGLIVWLLSAMSFDKLYEHFRQINYWMCIPAMAMLILHFFLRAYRWKFLLPPQVPPVSTQHLFDSIMIGNLATYILPLRAGEFIRPFLLSRLSPYSFATGFASVVVERFFDLAIVLLTFAYVISQVEGLPDFAKPGAAILCTLAIGILCFMILGGLFPKLVLGICSSLLSLLPDKFSKPILNFLSDILKSAEVIKSVPNLLRIIFLSILVWLANYLSLYLFLFMFAGDFSFLMALTVSVVVALAVAAPSAPGFVGVYQSACVAGFKIFGFSMEMAIAFSIVTHFLNYLLFGLFALVFVLRSKISFSEMLKKPESANS